MPSETTVSAAESLLSPSSSRSGISSSEIFISQEVERRAPERLTPSALALPKMKKAWDALLRAVQRSIIAVENFGKMLPGYGRANALRTVQNEALLLANHAVDQGLRAADKMLLLSVSSEVIPDIWGKDLPLNASKLRSGLKK